MVKDPKLILKFFIYGNLYISKHYIIKVFKLYKNKSFKSLCLFGNKNRITFDPLHKLN